jgi:IS5 family transposase
LSQLTFAEAEFENKKHTTRREIFLDRMDKLIPWARLEKKIAKFYPKGETGRPPYPLAVMLRVHCLQLFYNLSDPGMEDALYEIESMRRFAGLRLSERLPDETTILNFRHFLEGHKLGKVLFEEINRHLKAQNLSFREGTIVDATIISAPSSTKNESGTRDPEMHQTRKGQQWFFGMKLHIGVDDTLGLIHTLETTPANAADINHAHQLLHGEEDRVWADAGCTGIEKRDGQSALDWHVALRPGKRAQMPPASRPARAEKAKASVRAKVEHPFKYIKVIFGYSKVRYRGLAKNENRLHLLAGFTNLLIGRKYLLA